MSHRPVDADADRVVVAIRVVPASSRTSVGGRRGEALVVRVTAPAVDGRATAAAMAALAEAIGVRRAAVELVSGATSRTKLVAISGATAPVRAALSTLADARGGADETDGAPRC
jgi:uncharacterized protein (TIGR00251 family)